MTKLFSIGALVSCILVSACGEPSVQDTVFQNGKPIPISFTLLPTAGTIGKSGPISNAYRPQILFAALRDGISCELQLPAGVEQVDPGASSDANIICEKDVLISQKNLAFVALEGGRKIGEGRIEMKSR